MVLASSTRALMSLMTTLLPLMMPTDAKSLPASLSVMLLLEPAVRVAAPPTIRAPLLVMAPLVVTFSVPVMLLVVSDRALISLMLTLLPLRAPNEAKSFPASVKVMSLPAAVVFPAVMVPIWVMEPPLAKVRVPDAEEAANTSGEESATLTLAPLKSTVPPKVLVGLPTVISPVANRCVSPAT